MNGQYFLGIGERSYDVSPDARRFLMIEAANAGGATDGTGIVVALSWGEELKRLRPPNR